MQLILPVKISKNKYTICPIDILNIYKSEAEEKWSRFGSLTAGHGKSP